MRTQKVLWAAALPCAMLLAGCVVRSYPLTRDRVDQDLTAGNRGFVAGEGETPVVKDKKATRTTQVVEVELYPPVRFEKMPKPKTAKARTQDQELWGNRGMLTQRDVPEVDEYAKPAKAEVKGSYEPYTVKKGDTLQKISLRLYGTTKNWHKLYELNKDTLKGPNKIYPGQVIRIPRSAGREEMKENWK